MRTKSVTQMYLDFVLPSSPTKVVAAYRRKYGALNDLLLANPAVLDLSMRTSAAGFRSRRPDGKAGTPPKRFCVRWW